MKVATIHAVATVPKLVGRESVVVTPATVSPKVGLTVTPAAVSSHAKVPRVVVRHK